MQKVYLVHCNKQTYPNNLPSNYVSKHNYCTLMLTGTEASVAKYMYNNIDDAELQECPATVREYLAAYREYMEGCGAQDLWDAWDVTTGAEEIECYKNGYEWGDEWEEAEANLHGYFNAHINTDAHCNNPQHLASLL